MFKVEIPAKVQWIHICEIKNWFDEENIQDWDLERQGIQWIFIFKKIEDSIHFLLRFGGKLLQDELVT